jgi:hypothetical protein
MHTRRPHPNTGWRAGLHGLFAVVALTWAAAPAFAAPCVVPDNGSGTVHLPPAGCTGYVSPQDLHMMIDGLPPGTTIEVEAQHSDFFNVTHAPGGSLGGEVETFNSGVFLQLTGTGALAGFVRNVFMQANCETHTGPRTPGNPVQSFDTDMFRMQGQLPPGDPDFDLLRITAGTNFGMPSPGHTTLTQLSGGNWAVDSFFDITYRIDFVGAPGGALAGMSGSTVGTTHMQAGEPTTVPPPCTVVDNGTGTVDLPPPGCDYVSPTDLHMMIAGLPPGTTINVDAKHNRFFGATTQPGGSLGGEIEHFNSSLVLVLEGTGDLVGFNREIELNNVQCETHTGPHGGGTGGPQSFPTAMMQLFGQLPPGDPDFDLLRITGGDNFGLPSPGHTVLTPLAHKPGTIASHKFSVDSFFDITYRIDFVGAPGGPLGGMSGSTTGTIRMQTGSYSSDAGLPRAVQRTVLHQNAPNPFNPSTKITFDLAAAGKVRLQIIDVSGRVVRNLVEALMQPNRYHFVWDGKDDAGNQAASGTYFARLTAPDGVTAKTLVLVK